MTTPESRRASLNLPLDCLPGAALVEVEFADNQIAMFHKRAGISVVAALKYGLTDLSEAQHVVTFAEDSVYLIAMVAIKAAEEAGDIALESSNRAFACLHTATFDSTVWAEYLPVNKPDQNS